MVMSVAENLVHGQSGEGVAARDRPSRGGAGPGRPSRSTDWTIKVSGPETAVSELSGGNQQKVVVGKWLAAGVRVLLLDEPTKGIDVEARAALYGLLRELAASGVAILVAPTELEELFIVCDRIIVLRDGRVVADQDVGECDPAGIMERAMSEES